MGGGGEGIWGEKQALIEVRFSKQQSKEGRMKILPEAILAVQWFCHAESI